MRILAVEDTASGRAELARSIRQAAPGAEVVACANASEALAREDVLGFDVAFLDIDLPGMSGVELARRLKALNPRVNVVFATGYGDYMADAFELHSSGYLMKPVTARDVARELENLRFPAWSAPEGREGRLYLQCFGNFEAFADGRPVEFGRAKSKELLAYLVDRRGAVVTLREAEAVIWGEGTAGRPSGSYLRTLVFDLRRSLAACGHEDALVRRRGSLGIDVTQVTCDYYSFLEGDPLALNAWRGEYMSQYSWAEATKAALLRQAL